MSRNAFAFFGTNLFAAGTFWVPYLDRQDAVKATNVQQDARPIFAIRDSLSCSVEVMDVDISGNDLARGEPFEVDSNGGASTSRFVMPRAFAALSMCVFWVEEFDSPVIFDSGYFWETCVSEQSRRAQHVINLPAQGIRINCPILSFEL